MATANASGKGIVLSRLSKSYGRVRAVRSVDLEIAAGETVALLGPNGAGKTTTIDMVLGLSRPDSGSISLFGMSPPAARGGSSATADRSCGVRQPPEVVQNGRDGTSAGDAISDGAGRVGGDLTVPWPGRLEELPAA